MNRILKDEILNRIEQPCITGGWHEVSGEVTANAIHTATCPSPIWASPLF